MLLISRFKYKEIFLLSVQTLGIRPLFRRALINLNFETNCIDLIFFYCVSHAIVYDNHPEDLLGPCRCRENV